MNQPAPKPAPPRSQTQSTSRQGSTSTTQAAKPSSSAATTRTTRTPRTSTRTSAQPVVSTEDTLRALAQSLHADLKKFDADDASAAKKQEERNNRRAETTQKLLEIPSQYLPDSFVAPKKPARVRTPKASAPSTPSPLGEKARGALANVAASAKSAGSKTAIRIGLIVLGALLGAAVGAVLARTVQWVADTWDLSLIHAIMGLIWFICLVGGGVAAALLLASFAPSKSTAS
jgi:hypothetical protein